MSRLRTGVIGVGRIGSQHARLLSEIAEGELVGVYDISEERGDEIAAEYGTRHFASAAELCDAVDAVVIAQAEINWSDAVAGSQWQLGDFNLDAFGFGPGTAFPLSVDFSLTGDEVVVEELEQVAPTLEQAALTPWRQGRPCDEHGWHLWSFPLLHGQFTLLVADHVQPEGGGAEEAPCEGVGAARTCHGRTEALQRARTPLECPALTPVPSVPSPSASSPRVSMSTPRSSSASSPVSGSSSTK